GALLGDDLLDELGRDRLDVCGVGELRVGHDRGGVGVDQRHPQALRAQHAAGLGAGVIELAGLTDDDRARADHQDVVQIGAARHQAPSIRPAKRSNKYAASWGPAAASGWYCTENARPSTRRTPSTVPSLAQTWLTSALPNGVSNCSPCSPSRAKPWFCAVIEMRPVSCS